MRRLILPLILVAGLAAGTAFALGPASSPGPRISASVQPSSTLATAAPDVTGCEHSSNFWAPPGCPDDGSGPRCTDPTLDPRLGCPAPPEPPKVEPPPTTAAPAPVATSSASPSVEWWYELGRCEQPGSGEGGVNWTAGDSTYGGGLGFYRGTWDAYRGEAGIDVDEPDQATPAQQIAVGRAVFAHHGAGAWGCSRSIRAPY